MRDLLRVKHNPKPGVASLTVKQTCSLEVMVDVDLGEVLLLGGGCGVPLPSFRGEIAVTSRAWIFYNTAITMIALL